MLVAAKAGLVPFAGVTSVTVGSLISQALKSCSFGIFTIELMRIFFALKISESSITSW